MRFKLVLIVCRAAKVLTNLRICADSPEPLLLVYTMYGSKIPRLTFRPPAPLDMAWAFIGVFAHMR